jgi:hypothetical protein
MGLLDQLKSASDGVKPAGREGTTWRPAKDRTHPEGIEGVILGVGRVPVREPKENGPTHDLVLLVDSGREGAPWRVYGSTRELRDRFDVLSADGLLKEGQVIAIRFFGEKTMKAADGTPYRVHEYAVAVA